MPQHSVFAKTPNYGKGELPWNANNVTSASTSIAAGQ